MLSTVLIVAAVILAVLACLDRAAATIVRRRVARLIAGGWRTTSAPLVRIGGGPFLIQFIGGRYRQVRLTLPAFTAAGLDFSGLDASLAQVRAPVRRLLAGDGVAVGEISATFTIPFTALSTRLPPGLALRRRKQELQIYGTALAVPVYGTVEISADLRRISVTPRVAGVPSLVGFRVELPAMPREVTITSVVVTDVALAVAVAGRQVRLAAARTAGTAIEQNARVR